MSKTNTFDINTQIAFVNLALFNDDFCSAYSIQLAKFYYQKANKYEKIEPLYKSKELEEISTKIINYYNEHNFRPTLNIVKQLVHKDNAEEQKNIDAVFEKIAEMKITSAEKEFYEQLMTTYLKIAYYKKTKSLMEATDKVNIEDSFGLVGNFSETISSISFAKSGEMFLDAEALFREEGNATVKTITTGIPELDIDTNGGIPIETLTVVLAGTNVGKSMFCISLGCEALREKNPDGSDKGNKVFHIALEGTETEARDRYFSNLAGVSYSDIAMRKLNSEQKRKIKEISDIYKDRIVFYNMGFNTTVENVVAICREKHKKFDFNMLVIDYGQLLETTKPYAEYRFVMATVFRTLTKLARELHCAVISPAQSTRGTQNLDLNQVLTSADISEAFEIARVAGLILTLNMSPTERDEKKLRVFLEKNRLGVKGKTYGLITNYSHCRLITGEYYNPFTQIAYGEGTFDDPTDLLQFSIKDSVNKNFLKEHKEKIAKLDDLFNKIDTYNMEIDDFINQAQLLLDENILEEDDDTSLYSEKLKKIALKRSEKEPFKKEYDKVFDMIYKGCKHHDLTELNELIDEGSIDSKELDGYYRLQKLMSLRFE